MRQLCGEGVEDEFHVLFECGGQEVPRQVHAALFEASWRVVTYLYSSPPYGCNGAVYSTKSETGGFVYQCMRATCTVRSSR